MKFACESCSTKYVIPDERVFGKILRVRCKRCSSVMEVVGPTRSTTRAEKLQAIKPAQDTAQDRPLFSASRGSSDPFAAVTGSGVWGMQSAPRGGQSQGGVAVEAPSLPRAVPAPSSEPMWWMAIKGEARGPFTVEEVEVLAARGKIHQKTRVWRPGMPAWLRLREVGELGHIKAPERTSVPGNSEMTPAAGSSMPPPIPETAPITPPDKPFANLLSSQPPPPFPEVSSTDLTPPPLTKTGGTGWYVLSDAEASQLFEMVEDAPQHVPGTTPLMTGSHLIRRRTHRVAYAVVGLSVLMAVVLGLMLIPDLLPSADEGVGMKTAPVRAPVSNKPVVVQSSPEEIEALKTLATPKAITVDASGNGAEVSAGDKKVGNLKKAMTRQAQQLLQQ